jgi:hypothetical protein
MVVEKSTGVVDLSWRGDSGESEGKEVRDLSEAVMEDAAELVWVLSLRVLDLWPLELLMEAVESCEVERCRGVAPDVEESEEVRDSIS